MSIFSIVRKKSDGKIYLREFSLDEIKYHGPYKSIKGAKAARARKEKEAVMKACGLVKCKDSMGRTIWE